MPRLWLPNLEDAFETEDHLGREAFLPKVKNAYARCLFWLKPGDKLLLPASIPSDFVHYVAQLAGLSEDAFLSVAFTGRSLVSCLLETPEMLETMRSLGREGWTLEPYIETEDVVRLSLETGLPLGRTPADLIRRGVINRLNDKGFFKRLSRELGVEAVPSYHAENESALLQAVDRVSAENGDRVIVKKVLASGGLGNLAGGRDFLREKLPGWYREGEVIVEPLLDFVETAGSLIWIDDEGVTPMGVDRQRFRDRRWVGFDCPYPSETLSEQILFLSLRYARAIHKIGGRGFLNIDWGIVETPEGLRPLGIEINFRHNGFAHILNFVRALGHEGAISYDEWVMTDASLPALLETLEEKNLFFRPGEREGCVLFMPPHDGHAALAFLGETVEDCARLRSRL